MKIVSIIIVNWNGRELLVDCIDSVLRQTYANYEIILVDNGSCDDSVSFVNHTYPSVKTVSLADNAGFTGGNIAGYRFSSGDYIVLLNNDARLTDQWLEHMVSAVESDPAVGFCSSKIIIDGTTLIDSAGDEFTSAFTGTKIGEYEDESFHTQARQVPGACAAAVVYKREMLEDVGFLDPDFFLNHEDTDLNMRAWLAGWKCLFVPQAVVYHKVSASIVPMSDTAVYYFSRNNEWVWLKNVPLGLMLKSFPQRLIYEVSSFGFFCILAGRWRPYLRGKRDALAGIPAMLRKRSEVQRLRKLSTHEISAGLLPLSLYLKRRLQLAFSERPKARA
ncbi:glycosyltransferase family 2 protein [Geobacter sp.]|uniref:glycosyltransferase family 2 protein n=1 Tax=Geobacter sp. TaxID=46610 RepID=UPI001AC1BDE3|nr:glycosyltransferase family 2 protein [Geobacter sp.]CAG0956438.1 Poly-beta-1,6-N-acetyl-D-glucosamine synthase [Anaerolineales bacterium]